MANVLHFPTAFVPPPPPASSVEPVEDPEDADDDFARGRPSGPVWHDRRRIPGSRPGTYQIQWDDGEDAVACERAWRSYTRNDQPVADNVREIARAFDERDAAHAAAIAALPPVEDEQSEAAPAAKEGPIVMSTKAKIADAARDEQIIGAVASGASSPKQIGEATGFSAACLYRNLPPLVKAGKLVKTGNHRAARYALPGGKSIPPPPAAAPAPKAPRLSQAKKPKAPKLRPADVTPTGAGYRVHWRGVVIECPDVGALKDLVEEIGS